MCDTQKMTYFAKKMAKIATLRTRIRARVCAFNVTLRYVGAGRKPKADDRAIRRKKTVTLHKPEGFVYRTPRVR